MKFNLRHDHISYMLNLFVFVISIATTVTRAELVEDQFRDSFPWIGTLRLTTSVKKQTLTVLTVIQESVAIANAYEMATLFEKIELRANTIASFLSTSRDQWDCKVRDVIFHPEYNAVTKNTIALVFLKPEYASYWDPIRLPETPLSGSEDAKLIGITDKTRNRLMLSVLSTDPADLTECDAFYKYEGLDSKWMRPVHYSCYRIRNAEEACLNDAGMVLAAPEHDGWTLHGISIHGPGCSLPARFIEIFPYKPWIKSHLPTKEDDDVEIIAMGSRRFATKYQSSEITGESFDDRDSIIMNKLSDDSIVLKYKSKFDAYEEYGDCDQSKLLVYEEMGKIDMGPTQAATAVYSVSIYDIRVLKINCVKINIHCKAWSGLKVYYNKGFEQEDWESFVQIIPRDDLNNTNSNQKILYVQDQWMNYIENETITVWLKFEIIGSASLSAKYYGDTKVPPVVTTTLPTTTTTTTTVALDNDTHTTAATATKTRRARIYATHLRNPPVTTKKDGLVRAGADRTYAPGRTKLNNLDGSTNKWLVEKNKETSNKIMQPKLLNKYFIITTPSKVVKNSQNKTIKNTEHRTNFNKKNIAATTNIATLKSNRESDREYRKSEINNIYSSNSKLEEVNKSKTTKKTKKNKQILHFRDIIAIINSSEKVKNEKTKHSKYSKMNNNTDSNLIEVNKKNTGLRNKLSVLPFYVNVIPTTTNRAISNSNKKFDKLSQHSKINISSRSTTSRSIDKNKRRTTNKNKHKIYLSSYAIATATPKSIFIINSEVKRIKQSMHFQINDTSRSIECNKRKITWNAKPIIHFNGNVIATTTNRAIFKSSREFHKKIKHAMHFKINNNSTNKSLKEARRRSTTKKTKQRIHFKDITIATTINRTRNNSSKETANKIRQKNTISTTIQTTKSRKNKIKIILGLKKAKQRLRTEKTKGIPKMKLKSKILFTSHTTRRPIEKGSYGIRKHSNNKINFTLRFDTNVPRATTTDNILYY